MLRYLVPALLVASSPAVSQSVYGVRAPAPAGYDRVAGQRTTQVHLERLIRLNTQNPPGK